MAVIILVGFAAVALWSLVAHRFERIGIAGPAGLALLGALVVLIDIPDFVSAIDGEVAQHVVELILAVLLFVDASEVRGGVFGRQGRSVLRLVLIALPLSLALVVIVSGWMLPAADVFVLLVLACVVMPTDFSPATALLRSPRIPARIRQILNVESGYNDGLISPVFGMSLAIALALPTLLEAAKTGKDVTGASEAELEKNAEEFIRAFLGAVPSTLFAILVGIAVGALFGWLTRLASERGWANASGIRYVMLIVPLLTYGIAILPVIEANGFVAAFVAGIMFRLLRTRRGTDRAIDHAELLLVEEASTVAADFVWFVLGAMTTAVIVSGIDWPVLLIALLALTLFRMVPVYLAMLWSPIGWRDRTYLGALGPRGTASIVFGLLAVNRLPDADGDVVLQAMVLTVVGSIVLHGVVAPLVLRRFAPVERVETA
ncbi:cation:proton antiporter [Microbacterium sp. ASV49]|uniref:Cation:proton antiporter n=1 Tax=Microbacterium candidum TaxID=3041922 RepID=A0ABT7MVI9_9MICO|nr:cation:proton antiporter [Microbacterium sp. ASV49]MDL9978464.1 cation:proton antiporter [Microbacterium sp. ASV49]